MDEGHEQDGYTVVRRFLGDFPAWFHILRACLVVARRSEGEFAGAWVLNEARKFGIEWIPNLRPLVTYGILRRTGTARGGRRAYYAMVDLEGVRSAIGEAERRVNQAATEALGNAIYRYTFGIIGDGEYGAEARCIGTGVGVRWGSDYFILTAAHVVNQTPESRLYFFLPSPTLQFSHLGVAAGPPTCEMTPRFVLDEPDIVFADDNDLAAVRLPMQSGDAVANFYELTESHASPVGAKQVGFLGYPKDTRIAIEKNFMATPYLEFGEQVDAADEIDQKTQLAVGYPHDNSIKPNGLSGSGLWVFPLPTKKIWTPGVSLVGLVTCYDKQDCVLIGYRVEKVIEFLQSAG
jgi:hypothetical protein